MFDTYVINLKKRPDRLIKFKKNCPLKNVKTINAVDGKLYGKELDSIYINKLNKGEKGCFLSHINLWKKQVKEEKEYVIIFEDDAIFCDDFNDKLDTILKKKNLEKSVTYIGGRFTPDFKMKMKNCVKINEFLVKEKLEGKYDGWDCDRTTQAYIIHKDCAKLLLNSISIRKFCKRPVDHYILQVLRFYKKDILSSYPLLCYSPIKGDSDIR